MPSYQRITAAPESALAFPVRVRMRDGVHLATEVYLPGPAERRSCAQPGDTVLIRLPYDKSGDYAAIPLIAEYLLEHEYRVVAQDVRGKFRSEGEAHLFTNEAEDGADTLDWIVQQPWSNGRVVMWGDSYYGYTQWAAASTGHPALKAIAPRVTGTMLGEPVCVEPGSRIAPVEWAMTYLYAVTHFLGNDTIEWEPDWESRDFAAQVEAYLADVGQRSIAYDQWFPHAVHLPRFSSGSPFAARPIPVLHTIGWWDNCAPLSWADVDEIARHPAWAALHHLRVESIDHENHEFGEPETERVTERSNTQVRAMLPRLLDPALAFFEVYLRGNGAPGDLPRVSWQLAGSSEQRNSGSWPPNGVRAVSLFATEDAGLSADRPEREAHHTWVHDPLQLVPSAASDAFSYLQESPDEAPIGARDDVLVFTGRPVVEAAELVGPVRARLRVSTDGPVADFFVRLLDVHPDGRALRIARGQLQLRVADTPETLELDLGHLGYLLLPGHRLRVHISSSDYPEYLPQTGTGADPWGWGPTARTTQSLCVGGPDTFELMLSLLKGTLR